ncbi:formate/nitrite transporter family protein [Candidatus Bathyarchaeota archaeon]|nr:formate/nitrite transporter family protein [Candidatus Bathyarchaeota archaeon]
MSKKPNQIAQTIQKSGITKTRLDSSRLLILGILAGAYVGFGAQIATTVAIDAAQYVGLGLSKLIIGTAFSVGLMLVILGGAELFTGNSLICLSLICGEIKIQDLIRNWSLVYLGNFLGSIILVYIIYNTGLYNMGSNALGVTAISIANAKVNITFAQAFFRGVACNWLVCLAVWIATSAEKTSGKILACIFPIMAFVGSGFEHSIANMFFVPMGIMLREIPSLIIQSGLDLSNLNWVGFIVKNLLPVTLGNIVGGGFFVATLYGYVYGKQES